MISTVFLFVAIAISGSSAIERGIDAITQPMSAVMGLVYFLELIVWFYAVRHIDVSLASSITTPWPALTMVLAIPFLGETVALYQILALLVVIACIYGLTLVGVRKASLATTV
jgi:drug/metabolite transporter (DMT)-like permease